MPSKHRVLAELKRALGAFTGRRQAQQLKEVETCDDASQPLEPGEEDSSPAQVLSQTLRSFAEVDVAQLAISHGGAVPPNVEQQMLQIIENHDSGLEAQNNTSPLPSLQALGEYNKVFDMLDDLEPANVSPALTPEQDHSESQLRSEELLDPRVQNCLQFLFTGLTKQLGPCDLSAESKHRHTVSLHLTGFRDQIEDQSHRVFGFYLSSRLDWIPCRWLESRCVITKEILEAAKPGCGLIRDCEEAKKRLCILLEERQGGRLLPQPDEADCYASISTPTMSLGQLLDTPGLNRRFPSADDPNRFLPLDRATLCLNLALSLLQLSQDEWRQIVWCPENIFFLKNPLSGVVEEKTKPYLSWVVMSTPSVQDNARDKGELACDSHLLHFGRLLMEIHAFERIEDPVHGLELQTTLLMAIQDERSYLPQDSAFVAAVKACLSLEGKIAAAGGGGSSQIRDFIYRNIVVNLGCSVAGKERPQNLSRCSALSKHLAVNSVCQETMLDYDSKLGKTPITINSSTTARNFLKQMDDWLELNIKPLRPMKPPENNTHSQARIKIAIIDSGASMIDDRIRAAVRGKIKGGRNFLPSADPHDWDDDCGHGTIVTRLLLKYAPNADIYVAKVTEGSKIDSKGLFCVSQAINWAVQNWQVDIISMSFVVEHEHPGIEEELTQAIDPSYEGPGISRKIVFAAAGNRGGNSLMGWPARRNGVIAIHATDGLGSPVNINANPDHMGDNFATLGQDIEIEWTPEGKQHKEKIYVTGTSFATPIAVAIAANVLEFSRYNLTLTMDRKRTLYTGSCIRRIFREMAGERGGYDYVQSWTLWERQGRDIGKLPLNCIME